MSQWKTYLEQTELTSAVLQRKTHFPETFAGFKQQGVWPTVILCSSGMYRNLYDLIPPHLHFSRIIVDECCAINLPASKSLGATFHWFISASTMTLLFPYGRYFTYDGSEYVESFRTTSWIRHLFYQLWSFANSKTLAAIMLWCTPAFIQQSTQIPPPQERTLTCRSTQLLQAVRGILDPAIMRMLDGGDVEQALQQLPCPTGSVASMADQIQASLRSQMERFQAKKEYYARLLQDTTLQPAERRMKEARQQEQQVKIDQLQVKLRQAQDRFEELRHQTGCCPICFEAPTHPVAMLRCCSQLFCIRCIRACLARKAKCPCCRKDVTEAEDMAIMHRMEDAPPSASSPEPSPKRARTLPTKVEAFLQLLQEHPQGRILVFSEFDNGFTEIARHMTERHIPHTKVCGNGGVIDNIVRKFNQGEMRVLLLNAIHYGAGLNLQAASHIVLMHAMNPQVEQQVVGRAQRLGRHPDTPLQLVRLQHEHEQEG